MLKLGGFEIHKGISWKIISILNELKVTLGIYFDADQVLRED